MHLHIIIDSPVFTKSVRKRIVESGQTGIIFLVTKSFKEIDVYTEDGKSTQSISQVSKWLSTVPLDTITAHFLSTLAAYLILRLQEVTIVKWVVWGGDYYDHPKVRLKYQGPNQNLKPLSIKQRLGYQVISRAIRKVDCVVGNLCDLTEIDRTLNLNVDYKQLNHLWDSERFGVLNPVLDKKMILVGNSDDPSNYHLSSIEQIEKLQTSQNLMIPLSGVSNTYTQSLKHIVKEKFPTRAVNYLDAFLEESDYQKQLSQCSHLAYGHYRQQGMATLFAFLRSGKVCYLQSRNPYYQYLISEGFIIFALDQEDTWKEELTLDQKNKNKNLIDALLDPKLITKQWEVALNYGNIS